MFICDHKTIEFHLTHHEMPQPWSCYQTVFAQWVLSCNIIVMILNDYCVDEIFSVKLIIVQWLSSCQIFQGIKQNVQRNFTYIGVHQTPAWSSNCKTLLCSAGQQTSGAGTKRRRRPLLECDSMGHVDPINNMALDRTPDSFALSNRNL